MSLRRLSFLAALLAAGCGGGDGEVKDPGDTQDPPTYEKADWTIFVYGHGDHNLGPSLVQDMLEMADARLDGKVHVVVFADWNGSEKPFTTGTEWYRIAGGGADPELIATGPELNLDDPDVLAEAVATAFHTFPADRHGVIVWDHGGAWKLGFGSDTQDGTLQRPRGMKVREAAAAIRAGLDAAGMRGDRPLDFLSFDTCLMAGVEVISEMAPLAKVYIANAEIDYGAGWDYKTSLSWIAANPKASVAELGAAEADAWDAHHRAQGGTDVLLRSHVVIDTTRWDDFVSAYAGFSAKLGVGGGVSVGRSLSRSLPGFEMSSLADLGTPPELRDAGQFLSLFASGSDPQLATAASGALDALAGAIIAGSQGSLRQAQAGVHMELPAASQIDPATISAYRQLAKTWADGSGWDDGLTTLATLDDGEGPGVVHSAENTENPSREALPRVSFKSMALDVESADIQLGYVSTQDPDAVYVLGLIGTGLVGAGVDNTFTWRGGAWTLPGPSGSQFVTVGPWARLGADMNGEAIAPILQVIGVIEDAEGNTANAALLVDGESGEIALAVVFTGRETTSMFSLQELAGLSFTPMIPQLRLSTGEVSFMSGDAFKLPAQGLALGASPVPQGTAALFTTVSDVWGNNQTAVDLFRIQEPIQ